MWARCLSAWLRSLAWALCDGGGGVRDGRPAADELVDLMSFWPGSEEMMVDVSILSCFWTALTMSVFGLSVLRPSRGTGCWVG